MGNCCRNDSQGYFAPEGLAVQSCKGETSVAVWITALVVAFLTFRPVPLLLLAQCLWRLACSIKVSLSIRCRTKNHWLVKCILISQGGPVSGPNSGSGWRHFESVFAILQFFYLLPLLQQPLNRYMFSSPPASNPALRGQSKFSSCCFTDLCNSKPISCQVQYMPFYLNCIVLKRPSK